MCGGDGDDGGGGGGDDDGGGGGDDGGGGGSGGDDGGGDGDDNDWFVASLTPHLWNSYPALFHWVDPCPGPLLFQCFLAVVRDMIPNPVCTLKNS